MTATNIVGIDPHRKTFTATLLDERGGEIDHAHFTNNRDGHAAALAWATEFGPVERWGIEGASGLGRPLAEFLVAAAVTCAKCHPTRRHCGNAAGTRVRPTGSTLTASQLRPRPTRVSPGRSSTSSQPSRTRFVTGSPCGTTLARRCARSASNSSANSTRSFMTSPKSSGHSSRPRRPSVLASHRLPSLMPLR